VERKKVLLADDIELFLELEKTFFRRENFELLVARNGTQALEVARAQRPDLVLMDLNMPEMDGDECCRRIKSDPQLRETPVVIVTQAGREEDLQKCRAAGCDEILLKPINRHLFVETARRLLAVSDRAQPRVSARLRVTYGSGDRALTDYTINISTGGLFLETAAPLPPETPLALEFDLPQQSRLIRTRGRVAWVNGPDAPKKPSLPPGMGIQMLDLSLDDLHAIRDYIKERCLDPTW